MGRGLAASSENDDAVKAAVFEAIRVGYRHFDTAAVYGTEKPLGEAIEEALRLGLIKSRAELFITTKLWCNSTEGHLVLPAINQSLQNLRLQYVDLYLIHWPLKLNLAEAKIPFPKECVATINIKKVWEAMEKCQELGFTKSIGVSNFAPRLIEEILSFAKIPPAVNQVEMNPLWQQKKLNEFYKKNEILLTGYSPLGAFGANWGHNRVMECDVLQDIAKSRGKTVAQNENKLTEVNVQEQQVQTTEDDFWNLAFETFLPDQNNSEDDYYPSEDEFVPYMEDDYHQILYENRPEDEYVPRDPWQDEYDDSFSGYHNPWEDEHEPDSDFSI
ncbi:hypothetical protein E3N88_37835 [Mikania micrantha]|uniref:NADP-dependent oxidoreductase domain-containing protein n=1 Tax=Mikania micrantha TaxID=192012 RepID=A0A5N6LS95_9ASTR|nr:hypothetical protein E3N88_37835 [Mikania micrantha]